MFKRGTLWRQLTQVTERALDDGSLLPIPTEYELVEDGGIQFVVRVLTNLARKQRRDVPLEDDKRRPFRNPFLPYEPSLYVADASDTHACLLNKFNVVNHHLLIVTRAFESQDAPLNLADFTAVWNCLFEYEGLAFYNAGQVAGASQPHKHLQVVPVPLVPEGRMVPIEPLLNDLESCGVVGRSRRLPFPHAAARLDTNLAESRDQAAFQSLSRYRTLMKSIGLTAETGRTGNYNLLLTRRWMLLVPRYVETFESASLNALAFAGALLVRDNQQLSRLKNRGPMSALKHVATPPEPGLDHAVE